MKAKRIMQIRQTVQIGKKIKKWSNRLNAARWSVKRNQRQYEKLICILKEKVQMREGEKLWQ